MRCLITGATGHLGSFLTRDLLRQGHEVAIIHRSHGDAWRITDILPSVQKIEGDLSCIESSKEQITQFAAEAVIHLGWCGVVSSNRNDPRQILDNLHGSLSLLKMAHEAGAHTFIGMGSQAEYGPISGVLTEETITQPNTAYGKTKLSVGLLAGELCRFFGMRFIWFRLLATYGPKDDGRRLIPNVINELLARRKPSLTLGTQRWDYLYVDDLVSAINAALNGSEAQGTYVLGSGSSFSVREIVEKIRDLIDPQLPLGFGELPFGPQQIMHLEADPTQFRIATGWSPCVDLSVGLQATVEWHRTAAGFG